MHKIFFLAGHVALASPLFRGSVRNSVCLTSFIIEINKATLTCLTVPGKAGAIALSVNSGTLAAVGSQNFEVLCHGHESMQHPDVTVNLNA